MEKAAVTYRVKAKFYKMGKVIMMRSLTSFFYKCQLFSKRELLQSAELSLLIAWKLFYKTLEFAFTFMSSKVTAKIRKSSNVNPMKDKFR